MNFLLWLLIGLIAGVIAKAIMPGSRSEPSGWILTIVLGIVGAFVGGFLASLVGLGSSGIIGSLITATIGAVIIIALFRLFTGGRKAV